VIAYYLLRSGLWRRLDREKWRYFLGRSGDRLWLSRAYPLWRSLDLFGLLFRRRYAAAIVVWLDWRVALYEGRQG
jgi:hypothetical protein